MLRAALIGFGQVAEKAHVPALAERGVTIVAVCEASEARRAAAKALLPGVRCYVSHEDLLDAEQNLDFVDIATPPFLHSQQVLAALKRGRHVLCEKPLALTRDELEAIRLGATMAGKSVFTVHNWAWSPQWLKIEELLPSLGEIRHAELHVLRTKPAAGANPDDWRRQAAQAGGGILVDHGWHNLYLLFRLMRIQPGRLVARLDAQEAKVEEDAVLYFEFPKATALMRLSWRSSVRRNSTLVVGEKGVLELDDDSVVIRTATETKRFSFEAPLSAGSAHPAWFSAMLPSFFAEMTDAEKRGANLEEASFCVSTIQRAYQSARLGRNAPRTALARERAS